MLIILSYMSYLLFYYLEFLKQLDVKSVTRAKYRDVVTFNDD